MTNGKVDYQAVLAELEAERSRLDAAIAYFRLKLGEPAGAPPEEGVSEADLPAIVRSAPLRLESDTFWGMGAPDAAKKYLGMVKKKQSATIIARALLAGGLVTEAKNFYTTLYTTLRRLEAAGELVKIGSEWGLPEWYPARRREKRASDSSNAGENGST